MWMKKWNPLLKKYKDIAEKSFKGVSSEELAYDKDLQRAKNIGLSYLPAVKEEILLAESKLNVTLPTSYKEFLSITNGWVQLGMGSQGVSLIYSVDKIDFFRKKYKSVCDIMKHTYPESTDEKYFVYGDKQDYGACKYPSYMRNLVIISEYYQDFYAINPDVQFDNGEYEVWLDFQNGELYRDMEKNN